MDEDVFPAVILADETEPLVDPVHFHRSNTFPGLAHDLRLDGTASLRRTRRPRGADIHLYDLSDLRAFLPLAYQYLKASTLGHAGVSRRLQLTDVQERLGAAIDGDEPKTFLRSEPFDHRVHRQSLWCVGSRSLWCVCSRRVWPIPARPL